MFQPTVTVYHIAVCLLRFGCFHPQVDMGQAADELKLASSSLIAQALCPRYIHLGVLQFEQGAWVVTVFHAI